MLSKANTCSDSSLAMSTPVSFGPPGKSIGCLELKLDSQWSQSSVSNDSKWQFLKTECQLFATDRQSTLQINFSTYFAVISVSPYKPIHNVWLEE